jgi:uncharacterized protein
MFRQSEKQLKTWFEQKKRRKPLIIRGARQVGKSTLVKNFSKHNKLTLIEINLEKHAYLNDLFKSFNIKNIIKELESISEKTINNQVILFLDEIQACPQALPCLRYFYEDYPDLAVIAAGSLLEFLLNDHQFSMPVGRIEYFHLGPMTFSEFLIALNKKQLLETIKNSTRSETIAINSHQQLLELLRLYFYIGGMPEAILSYTQTNNLSEVSRIHQSIIQTYQDDFSKYANKKHWLRLAKIFQKTPQFIGNKTNYSKISPTDRTSNIKEAIDILISAKLLTPTYHSSCNGIPLKAEINEKAYKLFFLDIGLFNSLCGLDWRYISNIESHRLINEGVLAEQFIAQHLFYSKETNKAPELQYWIRESKSANAEIDFVLQNTNTLIPIEVKAGKSGTLKSLHRFIYEKNANFAIRFDLNKHSTQAIKHKVGKSEVETVQFELVSLPLYLVEYYKNFI